MPVLPLTSRRHGGQVPMVVAAVEDLPIDPHSLDVSLTFILRDFHVGAGVDAQILQHFPRARFVVVGHLTQGQACTCLLARDAINTNRPLLIAACDNGMDIDRAAFASACAGGADALVFSFRHNEAVLARPQAYGWLRTRGEVLTGVSIKQPISATPMADHAVVGAFWFARGADFVAHAEAMIAANDRINGEFYIDQMFAPMLAAGARVGVLEVARYIGWGTPADYEAYEASLAYWQAFCRQEEWASEEWAA